MSAIYEKATEALKVLGPGWEVKSTYRLSYFGQVAEFWPKLDDYGEANIDASLLIRLGEFFGTDKVSVIFKEGWQGGGDTPGDPSSTFIRVGPFVFSGH